MNQPDSVAGCQFALGLMLHERTNQLDEAKYSLLEVFEYDKKVGIAQDSDQIGLDMCLLQPDPWREVGPGGGWIARKVEYSRL